MNLEFKVKKGIKKLENDFNIIGFIINGLFTLILLLGGIYLKSLINDNKKIKEDIEDKLKNLQSKELCESRHIGMNILNKNMQDDIKEIKQEIKEGFNNVYNKIDSKISDITILNSSIQELTKTITGLIKKG